MPKPKGQLKYKISARYIARGSISSMQRIVITPPRGSKWVISQINLHARAASPDPHIAVDDFASI